MLMRFAHLSDTHLGMRQYGLAEREEDFYHAFEEAVARIIEERPDFVIHSGDLFDFHRPQPRALWVAQRCFAKLHEKGIPVFAITGNHDTLMRRGAMPPQVLFGSQNVRMLTEEEPFIVHKGVFIGGVPYTSKFYAGKLKDMLGMLAGKAKAEAKSVLVLHQGIDRFLQHEFELRLEDIPQGFDYYAMGHIHSRIVHPFGKGKLAYPGSSELWSVNEYDDYRRAGKGFFIVDLGGDEPVVQGVDVQLSREVIRERVEANAIESAIAALREKMQRLAAKPLVYLEVDSGGHDRKALHERLMSQLSELALSLRVAYVTAGEREAAKVLTRSFDIHSLIREALKDRRKAVLASTLFDSLSQGDEERALKEAEDFFEGGHGDAEDEGAGDGV